MNILCFVFRWHDWRINLNVDNRDYLHFNEKCAVCGKERKLVVK